MILLYKFVHVFSDLFKVTLDETECKPSVNEREAIVNEKSQTCIQPPGIVNVLSKPRPH